MADGWLSTGQAADQLGATRMMIYRRIDAGELKAHRFGRLIKIRQSDLDDFIEAARIEPGDLNGSR